MVNKNRKKELLEFVLDEDSELMFSDLILSSEGSMLSEESKINKLIIEMYKQVETSKKIKLSGSGSIVTSIASLRDEYGGSCEIINDDHCYVICLKNEDGTYSPTTHIFKEAFIVLKQLQNPV